MVAKFLQPMVPDIPPMDPPTPATEAAGGEVGGGGREERVPTRDCAD